MSHNAYACRLVPENFGAIASEKPGFDLGELQAWLEKNQIGYFVRDEGSIYDCKYVPAEDFFKIYVFEHGDDAALFRKIVKI